MHLHVCMAMLKLELQRSMINTEAVYAQLPAVQRSPFVHELQINL